MKSILKADYHRAFKDADIRGKYPAEIDEEVAYLTARAFVDEYKHSKVVVGRDMRLSTPQLHEAFVRGVVDAGADVLDIGMVHTPLVYYVSATENLPGVMITASHSPKEFNGLKLVFAGAIPLTEKVGLGKIRRRIDKQKFNEPKQPGNVKQKNYAKAYQRFIFKGIKKQNFAGMKILADAGNGMAGTLLPLLTEKLPFKMTTQFGKLDGRFPNRGSDPTLSKHQKPLREKMKRGKYELGIAFDGDADRIAFVDENGRSVNSAIIGAMVAEYYLKQTPNAKIGVTILTSRIFAESIKRAGGRPVLMRVGHAFIKQAMRKKDVVFSAEHSGHFYFKDYFYTDSVTLTLFAVLNLYAEAKKTGQSFSELVAPYQKYQQTEDVVVFVKDKKRALKKVQSYLKKQKPKSLKAFDGFVVDYGDVWGAVKPSVTEFALKVMFESTRKKLALEKQKELVAFIEASEKA
jgi:phosphomannomutase